MLLITSIFQFVKNSTAFRGHSRKLDSTTHSDVTFSRCFAATHQKKIEAGAAAFYPYTRKNVKKVTDPGVFLCPNRMYPSHPLKSLSLSIHLLHQGAKCFVRSVKKLPKKTKL